MEKGVNTALKLSNAQKIELNSVQLQNIEPRDLAPTGSLIGEKADFVLAFTNREGDVSTIYQAFTLRHGHKSLSLITNAYTSEPLFAYAFKLKEPNEGHSEAGA